MRLSVWKLGGSVLADLPSYRRCARLIAERLRREPDVRIAAVVSARCGETDELLALARSLAARPERRALDLLWSTGEIRSAALLALCLQAAGIRAVALDVHETGIHLGDSLRVDPFPVRRALARHVVAVVPGFLACGPGAAVVTLGRGGSDLSAVALAAALRADRCELIKDVPGYFTADPNRDEHAAHLQAIDYRQALRMARNGCALVQPAALVLARRAGLRMIVRDLDDSRHTTVGASRCSSRRAEGDGSPDRESGPVQSGSGSHGRCHAGERRAWLSPSRGRTQRAQA